MRIKITIDVDKPIPFSYHHYIQGMIYHSLDSDFSKSLHDDYSSFKFFTYSELKGKYCVVDKKLKFLEPVYFYVTSISSKFLNDLYISLMNDPYVRLGNQTCRVKAIEAITDDIEYNEDQVYTLQTLSPITCYKTDRKHFTTYYNVQSADFEDSIIHNIQKKYDMLFDKNDEIFEVLDITHTKEVKVKYKDIVYVAYDCRIKAKISNGYLKLLMHSGLGAKNSAGFGMVRIYK